MNGSQFEAHAVELLVGALQTLLGLLGVQEILQTLRKIEFKWGARVGGGVSDDGESGAEETMTNNRVTRKQTAACLFETSRICVWIRGFCEAAGTAVAFLTEKWNTSIQTIPLSGDAKASFLPQQ